jgi:hypothetical protein
MAVRVLRYQRLLEITAKLPPDEQEYVFLFLTANDRKLRAKLADLEQARREYVEMKRELLARHSP